MNRKQFRELIFNQMSKPPVGASIQTSDITLELIEVITYTSGDTHDRILTIVGDTLSDAVYHDTAFVKKFFGLSTFYSSPLTVITEVSPIIIPDFEPEHHLFTIEMDNPLEDNLKLGNLLFLMDYLISINQSSPLENAFIQYQWVQNKCTKANVTLQFLNDYSS